MEYRVPDLRLHTPSPAQNCGNFDQWPELRNQQIQGNVGTTLPAYSQPAYSRGHNALLLSNQNNVRNALPVHTQPNGPYSAPVNAHNDGRNTIPLQRQTNGQNSLPVDTHVNGHNALPLQGPTNRQNALPVETRAHGHIALPLQSNGYNALPVDKHVNRHNILPLQRPTNGHNALSMDTHVNGPNASSLQRQNYGHNALSLQNHSNRQNALPSHFQENGHNALPLHLQNNAQTTSHFPQYLHHAGSEVFTRQTGDVQGSTFFNIARQHQVQQAFNLSKDSLSTSVECAPDRVPALLSYMSKNNLTFDQLIQRIKSKTPSAGAVQHVSAPVQKSSVNTFQTATPFNQAASTYPHPHVINRLLSRIQSRQHDAAARTHLSTSQNPPSSIQNVQNPNNVSISHPQLLPGNNPHGQNQDFPMNQASEPIVSDWSNPNQIRRAVNNLHNNNHPSFSQDPRPHFYSTSAQKDIQIIKTTTCLNPSQGFPRHNQASNNILNTPHTTSLQPTSHVPASSSAMNVPTCPGILEKVDHVITETLPEETLGQKVRPKGKADQRNISNFGSVEVEYPERVGSLINSEIPIQRNSRQNVQPNGVSLQGRVPEPAHDVTKYPVITDTKTSIYSELSGSKTASISTGSRTQITGLDLTSNVPSGPQTTAILHQNHNAVCTTRSRTVQVSGVSDSRHESVNVSTTVSKTPPITISTVSETQNIRKEFQAAEGPRTVTIDINGVRHVLELPGCDTVSNVHDSPQNEAALPSSEEVEPERMSNPPCSPTGLCADGGSVPVNDNTPQQEEVIPILKKEHTHSNTANTLQLPAFMGREGIGVEYNKDICKDIAVNVNEIIPNSVAQLNSPDQHDSVQASSSSAVQVITQDILPCNGEIKSSARDAAVECINQNRKTGFSKNQDGPKLHDRQKVAENNESENLSKHTLDHVINPGYLPCSAQPSPGESILNLSDQGNCTNSLRSSNSDVQKTTRKVTDTEAVAPANLNHNQPEGNCHKREGRHSGAKIRTVSVKSKTELGGNAGTTVSDGSVELSLSPESAVLSVPSSSLSFLNREAKSMIFHHVMKDGELVSVNDNNETARSAFQVLSDKMSDNERENNQSPKKVPKRSPGKNCVQKPNESSDGNKNRGQKDQVSNQAVDSSSLKDIPTNCGDSEEIMAGADSVPKAAPKWNVSKPPEHTLTNQNLSKETFQLNENASRPVQKVAPFWVKDNEFGTFTVNTVESKRDEKIVAIHVSRVIEPSDALIDNSDDCLTEGYSSSGCEATSSDGHNTELTSRKHTSAWHCFESSCGNTKGSLPKLRKVRVSRDRGNLKKPQSENRVDGGTAVSKLKQREVGRARHNTKGKLYNSEADEGKKRVTKLQGESIDDGTIPIAKLTQKGVGRARHKDKRKMSDSEAEIRKPKFRRIRVITDSDSESDEEHFRQVAKLRRVRLGRRAYGKKELSSDSDDNNLTEKAKFRKVRCNMKRNRKVFGISANDLRTNENESDGDDSLGKSKCDVVRTHQNIYLAPDIKALKPLRVVLYRVDTRGKMSVSLSEKKQKSEASENRPPLSAVGQDTAQVMTSHNKNSLIASSAEPCQPLKENKSQIKITPSGPLVTSVLPTSHEDLQGCVVSPPSKSYNPLKENTNHGQITSAESSTRSVLGKFTEKSQVGNVECSGAVSVPNKNHQQEQKCSLVDSLVHGLEEKKEELRLLYKSADDDVILIDD